MSEGLSNDYADDALHRARRPIASLISKSEKAQRKLAPSTWQYRMLQDNLQALHIASGLMDDTAHGAADVSQDDLEEALRAFASMASRTEAAKAKLAPGTSQHTLAKNRLEALRIAEALVQAELGER